jgi:hypothetical protein
MSQTEKNPPPHAPGRSNKRRSRRQQPKISTKARAYGNPYGLGPNIASGILDLSETGVRLLLKKELPIGKVFEVVLEAVGGKMVKVVAQVVWTVPAADGTFVVGAHFQKNVNYLDLVTLTRV